MISQTMKTMVIFNVCYHNLHDSEMTLNSNMAKNEELMDKIADEFPYLTGIKCNKLEYVGIVQNADDKVISIYDIDLIENKEQRLKFLDYGDLWWDQSNRVIPISIFLGDLMDEFRFCLRTLTRKDCDVLFGPVTSLCDMKRRIKKRKIKLMRSDM